MPSQKRLDAKKVQVETLAEKMKNAKIILFTEYRGITVSDDTKLRKDLREGGNEYFVMKNSIISHAAKAAGIDGLDNLEGPTAVVIGNDDYVAPAKIVNNYAKNNEFYKVKVGVMDGKVIDLAEVKKLANLPSKETLYTMLASALLGNIRNLAVVLEETRKQKEAANA